jgi:WD40 repeat protein
MITNDASLTFSLQHTSSPSSLLDLIDDCYRFILGFFEVIEESAMHTYHSALPWSPKSSPIRKVYQRHMRTEVKLINAIDAHWDACIRKIPVDNSIRTIAFSHTGSALAVGSMWGVKIFETATGVATFEVRNRSFSLAVAFSPDDDMLVCGFEDGSISVWDVQTSDLVQLFEGHVSDVRSVAFSSCGTMIVSGSYDKTVRIWNMSSGRSKCVLKGHSDRVVAVCWYGTDRVISGSWDDSVRVWDVSKQECLMILRGHTNRVTSVASSCDSSLVASGSWDRAVKVYDSRSGDVLQTIGANDAITSVQFSADGDKLLYTDSNTATIWNLSKKEKVSTIKCGGSRVASSLDLTRVASSFGRFVKILDPENGYSNPETVSNHSRIVRDIIFAPDGSVMASKSYHDAKIWDTTSGDCLFTFDSFIENIVFSPNSAFVVCLSQDSRRAQVLNVHTRPSRVKDWRLDVKQLSGNIALSPCGGRLVSQSSSQLILWDSKRGKCLALLDFDSSLWPESQIAFAVDGNSVFSHSRHNIIQRWSISESPGRLLNYLHASSSKRNRFTSPLVFLPMQEKSSMTLHQVVPVPPQPECYRYSDDDNGWILDEDGKRILWLPPDRRIDTRTSKVYGKKIAIVTSHGRVYLADFSGVPLP